MSCWEHAHGLLACGKLLENLQVDYWTRLILSGAVARDAVSTSKWGEPWPAACQIVYCCLAVSRVNLSKNRLVKTELDKILIVTVYPLQILVSTCLGSGSSSVLTCLPPISATR